VEGRKGGRVKGERVKGERVEGKGRRQDGWMAGRQKGRKGERVDALKARNPGLESGVVHHRIEQVPRTSVRGVSAQKLVMTKQST
jgi:hypothetical protein